MNYLSYGDTILYPINRFSREMNLAECVIQIDHYFPNNENEVKNNLTDVTFKVTIVEKSTMNDEYPNLERSYFSDIKPLILKHNPQFSIRPVPEDLYI